MQKLRIFFIQIPNTYDGFPNPSNVNVADFLIQTNGLRNLLCIFAGYAAHWRRDGWSLLVHLGVFLTPVAAVSACLITDFLGRDTAANDFGGSAIVLACINTALCGFGFAVAHRTNARTC